MAREWQEHGSTAHAQYIWSAGCGIACPSHQILRSPNETKNFMPPGVAFGTMTVAAVLGFLIYKLQIALAHGRRVRETKDFKIPGVAFGIMTVAVPRGARGARFVKEF